MEGQRQPNLGASAVNRKDWELFGRVLSQLKIRLLRDQDGGWGIWNKVLCFKSSELLKFK
jgi:hypothetical protein